MTRRSIELLRIAEWPRLDEQALDEHVRGVYRLRCAAIEAYAQGEPVARIEAEHGIDRSTLFRMVKRGLLATCEWLLRKRLRQDWTLMCHADRTQALALVSRFKRGIAPSMPILTWRLKPRRGCFLRCIGVVPVIRPRCSKSPFLPPTGMVRWMSQFHVNQQSTYVREVQRHFAHHLGATRVRCDLLVSRMMKRTGSVALLRELCEF
jgi:hypothetical protein